MSSTRPPGREPSRGCIQIHDSWKLYQMESRTVAFPSTPNPARPRTEPTPESGPGHVSCELRRLRLIVHTVSRVCVVPLWARGWRGGFFRRSRFVHYLELKGLTTFVRWDSIGDLTEGRVSHAGRGTCMILWRSMPVWNGEIEGRAPQSRSMSRRELGPAVRCAPT